ncbi:Hpt domain-containing protein [Sphingomonas lenta]|uniref:Hpt domain-containing protein n=1 Tax=Sphingomonas lenta TaxID=1141887 RepID=UPI001595AA0C|nr:Hpt domain-containing protein [Sphingomonas lenta]
MIADRLRPLRVRFVERSARECDGIDAALDADAPDLAAAGGLAHRIAGAGGTLGWPDVSAVAIRLEDACDARDPAAARTAAAELRRLVGSLAP